MLTLLCIAILCIIVIVFLTPLLRSAYYLYQVKRMLKIFDIRMDWIINRDPRWDHYSAAEMRGASLSNWFGFRWPKDKHYK